MRQEVIVTLNSCEQDMAKSVAKLRYESNRSSGTQNKRIGPQSDYETDLEGVGSEIAFCKIANVYPDLSINVHPDHDALVVGARIDVKSTKHRNGRLLAIARKKNNPPDFYVLMTGEFPTYRFAGMMSADSLLAPDKLTDLGHGPTYVATQLELQSITQLKIENASPRGCVNCSFRDGTFCKHFEDNPPEDYLGSDCEFWRST